MTRICSWSRGAAALTLVLAVLAAPASLRAETGYEAWLRYAAIDDDRIRQRYADLPAVVVAFGDSSVIRAAQEELIRGVRGMLGRTLRVEGRLPRESAIVLAPLRLSPKPRRPSAWLPTSKRTVIGLRR